MSAFPWNRQTFTTRREEFHCKGTRNSYWLLACLLIYAFVPSVMLNQASGTEVGRYRFEEGMAGTVATSVLDTSTPGGNNGTGFGTPLFNSDVPLSTIPQTGEINNGSLEFDHFKTDYIRVNSQFPFHAPGDVTLEFWLKVPNQGHAAIFWSRFDSAPNLNRYHIFLAGGFDNGPFAPLFLGMDYLDQSGVNHQLLAYGIANGEDQPFIIEPAEWTHVGIVRSGDTYNFYRNGVLVWQTLDVNPNLPNSVGWEIAGRTHDFSGRIDEIRFSDRALAPSEFLNAIPEPKSIAILLSGGIALAGFVRKQRRRTHALH